MFSLANTISDMYQELDAPIPEGVDENGIDGGRSLYLDAMAENDYRICAGIPSIWE